MSRPAKFPYLECDGVLAFAHRGGTSAHPENTLPAFQHAIDLGFRYLETDVHATRDGVLLAFHDEELDRVTDMCRITEMDYADVAKARIDGREPIPLFVELLNSWPEARFNIDPKQDNAAEPLAKVLQEANALDRVCVTSFSDKRTVGIKEILGPRLCTGLGPLGTTRMRFSSLSGPFSGIWGRFTQGCLQIPTHQFGVRLVDRRLIGHAHERGLQVHVWTIDDPDEMRRLLDLGVDGVMTDRPEVLKSVLEERGDWR